MLLVLRIHFSCHLCQATYSSKISLNLFYASTQVICLPSWPLVFTCTYPEKSRAHHFNSFTTPSTFLPQWLLGSSSWKPSTLCLQQSGFSPLLTQLLSSRPPLAMFWPWAGHCPAVHVSAMNWIWLEEMRVGDRAQLQNVRAGSSSGSCDLSSLPQEGVQFYDLFRRGG